MAKIISDSGEVIHLVGDISAGINFDIDGNEYYFRSTAQGVQDAVSGAVFPGASLGGSYVLDDYGDNAYWAGALFRLKSDFTGTAAKVYRDGAGTVANIELDGDWLDAAAIGTHCSSNDGRVIEIGDQTGLGNRVMEISAVPTFGAKIYDGATTSVLTDPDNGQIACYFDGANKFWNSTDSTTVSQPNTITVVLNTATDSMTIYDSRQTNAHVMNIGVSANQVSLICGAVLSDGNLTSNSVSVLTGISASTSSEVWLDGSQTATGNAGGNSMIGFRIGALRTGSFDYIGYFQGCIHHNANKASEMADIHSKVNELVGAY